MRDWKRWTAVLLAGSLAFTAADDMKLIVQAYEMQNEQGQESYQAESKSKLDDLKEKAVLFQEFQGEEQRFDGTRAVDVSDHAEQIHKIETGSVVFRFKASKKADGVLLGAKDKTIDLLILSRLVDTFISRISLTMLPVPNPHNTVCVLSWEEARHWQSRSSGYSSS